MLLDIDRATERTTANGAKLRLSSTRRRGCRRSRCGLAADTTRRATSRIPYLALTLVCLTALLAGPRAGAQSPLPPLAPPNPPPPTQATQGGHRLKTTVDLVVLHVTVSNAKGEFVPSLKENDFRVYEDKVEQKLSV